MRFIFIVLLVNTICFGQNKKSGIIYDKDNNEPIEFVSIYNKNDNTTSNSDGRFLFASQRDSVYFYKVGYDKISTTFHKLKDTIYLDKSVFELREVVVTNAKTIYQKIKDSIANNYLLKPHTEEFFLRAALKLDGQIIRLQDMHGNVQRKTSIYGGGLELEKNDFVIQLNNMRQLGISKDENNIYFEFPSLFNIFSEFVRINAMGPDFEVIEKPFENSKNIKVEFSSQTSDVSTKSYGNYIINGNDNAILSFNCSVVPFYPIESYNDPEYSKIKKHDVSVFFKEDPLSKLYYMNLAKRKAVLDLKLKNEPIVHKYEMEILLYTIQSFKSNEVKSNVNEQKDIFKLKYRYNADFWNTQNQLLLTDEMQKFINEMNENNGEFKIKSNMN